jgi:hypothetical protein
MKDEIGDSIKMNEREGAQALTGMDAPFPVPPLIGHA